ncbi:MAG: hypothetical protein COX44_01240 [Candidatus Portnoybacteria bacterium CG23_combo_of_CG06-09_8_20_14_all_37_13]|uniref:DUF8128 domain-containing protein n=1 Tax=Candidatus Portnoybacteria bacterium CG23_combo_of_CG06-09_8_20_14_all_37_13 TaxID=1974819 RepID=A0A2G9YD74_9BACT|nr:MAG: hypothetical protein COX44_01240 [Candidatus Portnoybacteria bacterium CG23_combo_of_CG06-09_8_20_14_all_37_13]
MDLVTILAIIKEYIWLPLPFVLFWGFWESWIYYINNKYSAGLNWVILEINIPEQIEVTPKAMEQVMAGLHGIYKSQNLIEKYIQGIVPRFLSLEIVGINGEIHFLIRTEAQFRNLVEGQVYAQYPDAEIHETEDYSKLLPKIIPSKDWNLWGTEMILTKENYYPIRTYPSFKEEETEEGIIDPLASLTEIMSRLRQGEELWLQILISPITEQWHQDALNLVNKLIGKPVEKKKSFFEVSVLVQEAVAWFEAVLSALFEFTFAGAAKEDKKPDWPSMMQHLSPGEKARVEAIENKCAKIGFNSKIRFIYLARRDVFAMGNVAAFMGSFKQFNIQDLNSFRPDPKTKSSIDYLFKNRRSTHRRRKILTKYRWRSMSGYKMILNIEELASIYHFPGIYVKAPRMPRVEAKKSGPPIGLPIG